MRSTRLISSALSLAMLLGWLTPTAARGAQTDLTVTVADAGIDSYAESGLPTTPTLAVETFNNRDLTSNGTFNFSGDAGAFSGTGWIQASGPYGGSGSSAGTVGRFATANNNTITLTMPDSSDYRYVGFWWSGGNSENYIDLIEADGSVGASFQVDAPNTTEDLAGIVGSCGPNPPTNGYCGNPNYSPRAVPGERYAFVHLRYPPGFRQVRFSGAGFEFDNVTVSITVPDLAETETTTVTFNPYTISTPSVLLADPKTGAVSFSGVTLGAGSGETNAMLCFSEVQSATAGAAAVTNASVDSSGSASGITTDNDTNLRIFFGARDTVVTFSSNIDFIPTTGAQSFSSVGSRFIRVTATPQTNLGTAGCTGNAVVSTTIEIRFLRPYQSNSINIPID